MVKNVEMIDHDRYYQKFAFSLLLLPIASVYSAELTTKVEYM